VEVTFFDSKFLKIMNSFQKRQTFSSKALSKKHLGFALNRLIAIVISAILFSGTFSFAQTMEPVCRTLAGCNLSVEIVRLETNISPTCQGPFETGDMYHCSNVNRFRQIPYMVYLKYTGGNPDLEDFHLNYDMLSVDLYLQVSGASLVGKPISRINWGKTNDCFKDQQVYTADDVLFSLDECFQKISFDLSNINGPLFCNTPGRQVLFKYGYINPAPYINPGDDYLGEFIPATQSGPNNAFFAPLFPIIVDAYPGESISFNKPLIINNQFCDPQPPIGTLPTNVGFYLREPFANCNLNATGTGIQPLTVAQPPMTTSQSLQLKINQTPLVSGQFDIGIQNLSAQSQTIHYVEFMLKMSGNQSGMSTPMILPGSTFSPSIIRVNNDFYLHYKIEPQFPITIPANSSILLSQIVTMGPLPLNKAFTVILECYQPEKFRIESDTECTKLAPMGQCTASSTIGVDPVCSGSQQLPAVRFVAEVQPAKDCRLILKVGLENTGLPLQTNIKELSVTLKFELPPNGDITLMNPVDYLSWVCDPLNNCPSNGGMTGVCHSFDAATNELKICISATNLALNPSAFMSFEFAETNPQRTLCINNILVKELRVSYTSGVYCVPDFQVIGVPICPPKIGGELITEGQQLLQDAQVDFLWSDCTLGNDITNITNSMSSLTDGMNYTSCAISEACQEVKITPVHDLNHINGVSTFDLVLISKHILGIEPLMNPYKMIAADANKSGSITTFDIVELRKLILGVYTELPDNTSWRFVDKAYSFPNPSNPFANVFPENIFKSFPTTDLLNNFDFIAIKIGDLNGNAVANSKPANRPPSSITWEIQASTAKGHTLLVPIRYTGAEMLEAIQLGLRFDPDKLKLNGTVIGEVPGFLPENFNLKEADKGIIKANWVLWADALQIKPGQVLFYLNFEVKDALPEDAASLLQLDDNLMENIAWRTDDQEFSLLYQPQGKTSALPEMLQNEVFSVRCFPNPGSGFVQFGVNTRQGGKYRVSLNDAAGQRLLLQDLHFAGPGEQTLQLQGSEKLPAGVYLWRVWNSTHKLQGIWIKQ